MHSLISERDFYGFAVGQTRLYNRLFSHVHGIGNGSREPKTFVCPLIVDVKGLETRSRARDIRVIPENARMSGCG